MKFLKLGAKCLIIKIDLTNLTWSHNGDPCTEGRDPKYKLLFFLVIL